ncbi:MAG: hypothetical protein AYK18_07010 [Theionarchaea archaeon DG-70]|nr:MAG: hypothetical protein AYK18_07010 [Theionarchaea archaeon DG-70]
MSSRVMALVIVVLMAFGLGVAFGFTTQLLTKHIEITAALGIFLVIYAFTGKYIYAILGGVITYVLLLVIL